MRWILRIAFVLVPLLLVLYFGFSSLQKSFDDPLNLENDLYYVVEPGSTIRSVGADLESKGVDGVADKLKWISRLDSENSTLFAGAYSFHRGISAMELYQAVTSGTSLSDEVQVTVVEGLTVDQIGEVLVEAGLVNDVEVFHVAASSGLERFAVQFDFLEGLPDGASLEGYLFPDTYRFFKDAEPDQIIVRMLENFSRRVTPEMRAEIEASGRTLHEVITLASIIQDEVRSEEQMFIVAGIFQNRLDIGMALQSDATINYITRSGRDRSTTADLEIDSPYNTYKYAGLPPGPVGAPGLTAIRAAINPEETDYLYFLTDKAGRVYYGETFADHQHNRQYLDRE